MSIKSRAASRPKLDGALTLSWRIYQQWGRVKLYVGIVAAPVKSAAIQQAISQFQISDPDRLIAEVRD
jgi:hypothetical protein